MVPWVYQIGHLRVPLLASARLPTYLPIQPLEEVSTDCIRMWTHCRDAPTMGGSFVSLPPQVHGGSVSLGFPFVMLVLLTGRTKALNELRAALVDSLRLEVPDADRPVVSTNVHWIRRKSPAQTVLPDPSLGGVALGEHPRRELRLWSVENPNDAH
jgi:hypothetical protein